MWYDRYKLKGVLERAEIIPLEPDPGNAGVGSIACGPLYGDFSSSPVFVYASRKEELLMVLKKRGFFFVVVLVLALVLSRCSAGPDGR